MGGIAKVRHVTTRAGSHVKFAPVAKLGRQFAFKNDEYMSALAPVIGNVPGSILDKPNSDVAHMHCAAESGAGFTVLTGR